MFETVTIFLVFVSVIQQVASIEDGDKRCPIGAIGPVKCPDSNPFYYYKCCGAAGMDCCFKLQTWLIILLVVVAVLSIASLIVALVRCLCCDR